MKEAWHFLLRFEPNLFLVYWVIQCYGLDYGESLSKGEQISCSQAESFVAIGLDHYGGPLFPAGFWWSQTRLSQVSQSSQLHCSLSGKKRGVHG